MANNQTIATVPANLTDETSLRRFLTELVGNLNTVLGYNEDEGYATSSDITAALTNTNSTLQDALDAVDSLEDDLDDLSDDVDDLSDDFTEFKDDVNEIIDGLEYLTSTNDVTTSTAYFDLSAAVWDTAKGAIEFTAVAEDIQNPPYELTEEANYTIYAKCVVTTGGVWQEFIFDGDATIRKFIRLSVGGTWYELAKV